MTAYLFALAVLVLIGLSLLVPREWMPKDPEIEDDPWTHPFTSPDGAPWCEQEMEDGGLCDLTREQHDIMYPESAPPFMPEECHKYVPNKADPGHCAAMVPVRGVGDRPCLLSREFHDE